jgi:hypothetical protein
VSGNELTVGLVNETTEEGTVCIRVSEDPSDYQRARVYKDDALVESLLSKEGAVVYPDEAAMVAAAGSNPAGASAR